MTRSVFKNNRLSLLDPPHGHFRFGTSALPKFVCGCVVPELSLGSVRSDPSWELSLGISRLVTFARDDSFRNFRVDSLA